MAIALEEAYEIIRRYRPDMRLQFDHVCNAQEEGRQHELFDCLSECAAVYTTSDALSDVAPTLETRLQKGESLKPTSNGP